MHGQPSVAALAAVAAILSGSANAAAPVHRALNYHVTRTVVLGLPDRWDYVQFDAPSHRVYVAHGDHVTVVDSEDGNIVGQVGSFPGGTHGIAIVTATGRGYTDDGRAGMAASFDLATLKVEKMIKAEEDADGIVFDPASGNVFVINGDSNNLTVIDPLTDAAIATIAAGGKLEFAAAGGNGKLYVDGEQKREIVRIDTRTNQVDARWPIANCESPHGLAIDRDTPRLFASCVNGVLVVVNADDGRTVATLPIGLGTDTAAFDSKRKRIFSSNGKDGTLSVIEEKDANTFVAAGTIKTAVSARTMAVDPVSGRIYLAAADVDPNAVPVNGRRPVIPGSLKLIFLDPAT
ncbi:MAG: YncE family protein [Steroidobacteraceae bacterium]